VAEGVGRAPEALQIDAERFIGSKFAGVIAQATCEIAGRRVVLDCPLVVEGRCTVVAQRLTHREPQRHELVVAQQAQRQVRLALLARGLVAAADRRSAVACR